MESILSSPTAHDPRPFEDLEPASRCGWERAASSKAEKRFEEVESELERTWPSNRGSGFFFPVSFGRSPGGKVPGPKRK